ncbi:Hsp20/alpha crystallin family protein [Aminipila terrae]|uniref:Hsp20 family protein n=1 Tax=Aminipila terrae TaxID=2697030 RepID=A0A6P1MC91_9FIRM|nr:Hsp20/alpha crystallin family protein [Aminipila terrae]QHI71642.1 Hsp20 family protein [Aminipila terrae]
MFGLTPLNRNQLQKRDGHDFIDFYNMLDDFFSDNPFSLRNPGSQAFKLDVKDQGNAYLVEAEMPGTKKEEIKLDYQNDYLIIKVEKNEEINEEKENFLHRERRSSSMQRSVYLKDIDVATVEAKLEDGILKISLPKIEQPSNKLQIEIK